MKWLILLAVVIAVSGCTQQESINTNDFLTYEDVEKGVRIRYPPDWTIEERTKGFVEFLSPQENIPYIRENLNIFVKNISFRQMTLDEYTESQLDLFDQLESTIIESSSTSLGGNPAQKVIYIYEQGFEGETYDLKIMNVWTIKDDNSYFLSYAANLDEDNNHLGNIQAMINSFEII